MDVTADENNFYAKVFNANFNSSNNTAYYLLKFVLN